MTDTTYNVMMPDKGVPIKAWTKGVPVEDAARQQLLNVAQLPFIYKWVAAMPDVHLGIGATVGSVIPTSGAIIPAAVGVDIGCGMMAVQTTLHARATCRTTCTRCAPRSSARCRTAAPTTAARTTAARGGMPPPRHARGVGASSSRRTRRSSRSIRKLGRGNDREPPRHARHRQPLHRGLPRRGRAASGSCCTRGSRGVGNRIGTYFIELAKQDMRKWIINLPDQDLAYLPEGTRALRRLRRRRWTGRRTTR